ncbi:MAG TPA: Ig-like domain-containing protein [Conexibacter sp.]
MHFHSSKAHVRVVAAAVLALGLVLTIAALALAAPSLSIDSGPSGPTSDTMPSFGFTVDVSATTVECSIDQGTEAYEACTSPYAPSAPLADGDYTFRVRASDGIEEEVRTQAFTVDTAAPSLSIDAGPSGPTNDATPSFAFTAEPGATVECSVDQGTPAYGSCTSAASHTAPSLGDGSYTFRVRARDAAGNEREATRAFTVDTAPPSLSIDSGPSGLTRDPTPTFGFTAGAGSTVQCSVDQGTPAYRSCSSAASHTASPLADGLYTFRVRARDAAGNEAEATRAFTVDTTPPSVSIDSGPGGPTSDATPTFGFTADVSATTVECSIDQGSAAYSPCSGTHTPGAPLSDGAYTFRVRATDAVGNQRVATQSFSVDSEAPSLSIDSGPAGPTNDSTPTFGFTAEPGTSVECSVAVGSPAYGPCNSTTTYVVGTTLPDGSYAFRVRARDGVGNQAVQMRSFTVDTLPPSLSIGFGPSGTTNDSTPLFGFTAEAGATLACSIDQGTAAFGSCASATTHAAGAPLADGAYTFRVRATDAAGNQTSLTRAFTVATAPRPDPTPPVTPPRPAPQLLSPFPLVRISGTLTATGARIRLLTVRAAPGVLVRVTVSPGCGTKRRSSRRCRVLQASATVGRRAVIGFRGLERAYRSGTVIVVRVWRADRIGKYTRFTIVRGKAPRRVDQCLAPGATRGSRCPSA